MATESEREAEVKRLNDLSFAKKLRAEAHLTLAKADQIEGKSFTQNYELSMMFWNEHCETNLLALRKALGRE